MARSYPALNIIRTNFSRPNTKSSPGLGSFGVQEINIVDIVKPITKYAVTVERVVDIKFHLEKAFYMAHEGRPGPVWLDIPADIQKSICFEKNLKTFVPPKKIESIKEKKY